MEKKQQNLTIEIHTQDKYIKSVKIPQMTKLTEFREILDITGVDYYFQDKNQNKIENKEEEEKLLVEDITVEALAKSEKHHVVIIRTIPVSIPTNFQSKQQYVETFTKLLNNEVAFDSYKERIFKSGTFELDLTEQRNITKRIFLYTKHSMNLQEKTILQLKLFYAEKELEPYEGFGVVYQVHFLRDKDLKVIIDINIKHPFSKTNEVQKLPKSDPNLYNGKIEFALARQGLNYDRIIRMLETFEATKKDEVANEMLKQSIISGVVHKNETKKEIPANFQDSGLPIILSATQIESIKAAFEQRLTLIQGPPGTGKTLMVSALVANLLKVNKEFQQKILVCAPSNAAADLIAERFSENPMLKGKFIRFYSEKKEDYFNIQPGNLKDFTLQYRILNKDKDEQQVDNEHFLKSMVNMKKRQIEIKQIVDFYFTNQDPQEKLSQNEIYDKERLDDMSNKEGWIQIQELIKLRCLRSKKASKQDILELAKFASDWEISKDQKNIRRKKDTSSGKKYTMFGFDIEKGIRTFDKKTYQDFVEFKRYQEDVILYNTHIIVTTLNSSVGSRLSKYKFKKVIIDEAAQSSELECLQTLLNANQVIMIGDHKQIGPIYESEIVGPDSMFTRLVQADYPYKMLDIQYRMHPYLLQVPNFLFYDNMIQNGYKPRFENAFIHKDYPLLFIDTDFKNQKEERYGTSFINKGEAALIKKLLIFIRDNKIWDLSKIGIVSPYAGQVQILMDLLKPNEFPEISQNIRSVDGWQGREKEVIIFSSVRSNRGNIGFLNNPRRTNVALTRAMHGMIIIGNKETLSSDKKWKKLIKQLGKNRSIVQGIDKAKESIIELNRIKHKDITQEQGEGYNMTPKKEEKGESHTIENGVDLTLKQQMEDDFM